MGQKSRFAGDNPGWGWIAGGIYFGADIVTKLSTKKSIGEHLDAAIEERYDIDNGVLLAEFNLQMQQNSD